MRTQVPSKPNRVIVRTGVLLFFIICGSSLAQAQWDPTSTGSNDIHNTNSGNIGIGTTSPNERLSVSGNIQYVVADGSNFDLKPVGQFGFGLRLKPNSSAGGVINRSFQIGRWDNLNTFTALTTVDESGNFGIGTTNPSQTFHVFANSGSDLISYVQNTGGRAVTRLDSKSGSTTEVRLAQAETDVWSMLANGSSFFLIRNEATGHYPFSINSSEYIGIGTTNPTHTLDVLGTINASGAITGNTINATYQDVAEWVPSTQVLPAATVVILDPEQSTRVIASTSAYDTRVAGVISARPGLTPGEAGPGRTLVATTGRVRVKVDATRAPIRMGDLLVTSDVQGVAMRSEPLDLGGTKIHRPGTIIGKALEPLEKGTGEILVLLSLQ